MFIKITSNKMDKLEEVAHRMGQPFDKVEEMIPSMLIRECQLFLTKPISYTKELEKKYRVFNESDKQDKNGISLEVITVPDIFPRIVKGELEKTRGRKGTGISAVSESKTSTEQIIIKMLIKEIDLLNKKKDDTHFYNKEQFMEMEPTINQIVQEKETFPKLISEAIKEYNIDVHMFVCYLLLSVQLKGSLDDVKKHPEKLLNVTEEEYVRAIISIKLKAMESYIQGANDAMKQRWGLDFINDYTNTDVIAFYIRQYTQETPISVQKCSVRDLKKEIKKEFKQNL